jgi:hypothetical protein
MFPLSSFCSVQFTGRDAFAVEEAVEVLVEEAFEVLVEEAFVLVVVRAGFMVAEVDEEPLVLELVDDFDDFVVEEAVLRPRVSDCLIFAFTEEGEAVVLEVFLVGITGFVGCFGLVGSFGFALGSGAFGRSQLDTCVTLL